jgi:hypothetical protein
MAWEASGATLRSLQETTKEHPQCRSSICGDYGKAAISATGRSSHRKWKSVGYGGHLWYGAAVVSADRGVGDYGSFTGRLVVLDAVRKQEALRLRVHRVSV